MRKGRRPKANSFALLPRTCAPRGGIACDGRVVRALELMQQSGPMPALGVAAFLNLSPSRFRHLFKDETGMTVRQYQKLVRLQQAKSLLTHSFLRIKEVAAAVGIGDVSHFTRDYKALYGQTPSRTRALSVRPLTRAQKSAIRAKE